MEVFIFWWIDNLISRNGQNKHNEYIYQYVKALVSGKIFFTIGNFYHM